MGKSQQIYRTRSLGRTASFRLLVCSPESISPTAFEMICWCRQDGTLLRSSSEPWTHTVAAGSANYAGGGAHEIRRSFRKKFYPSRSFGGCFMLAFRGRPNVGGNKPDAPARAPAWDRG